MPSLFCILFLLAVQLVHCAEHVVYWNTTSDLFENSGHPSINVRMGDRIRVFCPDKTAEVDEKYLVVYQVTEMAQVNCMLESSRHRVIRCGGEGMVGQSSLINIVATSAVPNALEFYAGGSFFWMSTSKGTMEGINLSSGGLCKSDNMRLQINVFEDIEVPPSTSTAASSSKAIAPGAHTRHHQVSPRRHLSVEQYGGVVPPGVDIAQLNKVAAMAANGFEGTYLNDDKNDQDNAAEASTSWAAPSAGDIYRDVLQGAENMLYESIQPKEEFEFVVHEDPTTYARSYPYQSNSGFTGLVVWVVILITMIIF